MSTAGDFREVMAAAIKDTAGVRCNSKGYLLEGVNPPEAMIDYEVNDRIAFGSASVDFGFVVILFAGRTSTDAAQKFFDLHRDPQNTASVWRAIEDADYSTTGHYARVTACSRIQPVKVGDGDYLAVEFTVEAVL